MSEARHTRGPWQAGVDIPEAGNNNYDPGVVWKGSKMVADCRTMWVSREEVNGNARLIAAAPDLLEACEAAAERLEEMLTLDSNVFTTTRVRCMVLNAIAKAKGGENDSLD